MVMVRTYRGNMVHIVCFLTIVLLSFSVCSGQESNADLGQIGKAIEWYQTKEYRKSAEAFGTIFRLPYGESYMKEYGYIAACAFATIGMEDSAFSILGIMAARLNFSDYNDLLIEPSFEHLRSDARWYRVCNLAMNNRYKEISGFDKRLIARLDTLYINDQRYRLQLANLLTAQPQNKKSMDSLFSKVHFYDSTNQYNVEKILKQYGWAGPKVFTTQGNMAIFLVIQHAEISFQKKYLSVVKVAAKNKFIDPSEVAVLEDRIAISEGRRQLYGSQVKQASDGRSWISPIEDPDNVDKRRRAIGLEPIGEYVKHWNMTWDLDEYKKQLPKILEWEKEITKSKKD